MHINVRPFLSEKSAKKSYKIKKIKWIYLQQSIKLGAQQKKNNASKKYYTNLCSFYL